MTNSEKQERYRRKEALKKMALEAACRIQLNNMNYLRQGIRPTEIQKRLDTVVNLPANWTDEDYNHAEQCIKNILLDMYGNPNLLENDLTENHNPLENFTTSQNALNSFSDLQNIKKFAQKLKDTIFSVVSLSGLSPADASAVLIDVLRILGREIMDTKTIPQSNATALTMATIGQQYQKPEWFIKLLSRTLGTQLGEKAAHSLGEEMMNFKI